MDVLWYKQAAANWNEALPVGNGRLGAMVFGGTGHEIIQLNEESVWSGIFHDRNNPSSLDSLSKIRALIKEERITEAQKLMFESMSANPSSQAVYQSAGELQFEFTRADGEPLGQNCQTYRRELDLETAVATTSFTAESDLPSTAFFSRNSAGNSITYTREVFASAVTNVIVIHITASAPGSIYFRANFDRGDFATKSYSLSDDTIVMEDTHGIPFAAVATAVADGGKLFTRGACLVAEAADEVTIYLDIQSAYRKRGYAHNKGNVRTKPDSLAAWCRDKALKNVCFATGAQFPTNKENHIAEYTPWYKAVSLSLDDAEDSQDSQRATDELLAQNPQSPLLAQLYWNFSRYLLISSSRKPGTLPANMRGLWNKDITPSYGSRYITNVNTQMNYWAGAMCSVPQTDEPLFNLLSHSYKNGKTTARVMYGCSGYAAHHSLDIWGDTAPQGNSINESYWPLGAAWLSTQIREHYEYTQDKKFLRKNYYLMRDAGTFFADYLVQDEKSNTLSVVPSVSPQSSYTMQNGKSASVSAGSDLDNRILEHLFRATLDSARDLGISAHNDAVMKIKAALAKLEPPVVTQENTIRERPALYAENEVPHGRLSQLYGLFPGHSINLTRSPLLAKASHNTIEKRLSGTQDLEGWSWAWILNFRASLHEQSAAYDAFNSIIKTSTMPNLLNGNGSFQIDANLGAAAGLTRMIVQSEIVSGAVECTILPALPDEWKSGSITGVSLKGNLKADISWKDGAISSARIYALHEESHLDSVVICYKEKRYESRLDGDSLNVMNVLPTTV